MRKLTILLAATVIASQAGCCGCGRIRNWFHKGSPCGTAMTPAVLGAPLAMGTPVAAPMSAPMMSAPMMAAPMMAAPMVSSPAVCCDPNPCCVPCNPCCDPCASGQGFSGYSGGYVEGSSGCECSDGMSGDAVISGATMTPDGATILPGPAPEN